MNLSPPDPRTQLLDGPLSALPLAEPQVLLPGAAVFDAARLLAARRVAYLVVTDAERRPLGVVTESRLLSVAQDRTGASQRVDGLMEAPTVVPHDLPAVQACRLCSEQGGQPLLWVDAQGRLAGAADEGDFRAHLQLAVLAGRHRVASVMARVLRPLAPMDTLARAIEQMRGSAETAVVVTEGEHAVGVLTTRDVARLMGEPLDPETVPLVAVMSRPVQTLSVEATVNEAAARMLQGRIRHLVIVDASERVVGVLDEHELTRALALELVDAGIEEERSRHRALMRHIPDLIWLKDPDGVYVSCNARFERLYGAPEARIRGRTDFDFVPPDVAEFFRANDRRALERDGPTVNEEQLTYADDGHTELVQTVKTPVRDDQGRLLGVLGIGRDITALRRAEDEYRWLFERNPAPMFVYDRQSLQLLKVNEAFCALYGFSEAEALALHLTELYLPEDRDTVARLVPTMRGLVNVGEWRHRRRDGSVLHVMAQSHDTVHEGRAARVVALTDVTALQRARERDRQRLVVMERLARGDRQRSVLERLALDHEEAFPGSLCSVLLLDADSGRLRHAAAPSLPEFYNAAIDGLPIGPEVGSCGAAAHGGRRVVVEDILAHPNWAPFRELVQRAGLRSCWSEPIPGPGGRVLGTFAIYRREVGAPGADELEQMQFAVQLAATTIGHAGTASALRESERRLDGILQALPDMVWLKDTQGVFRMCNASFARMAGLPADAIVGRRDVDITQAELARTYVDEDREVLSSGRTLVREHWYTVPGSGERLLAEVIKSPLLDDEGRNAGVLGVARDITLIKAGASAIAEQDRLIDTLLGQTTDSILLLDPDDGRFITFNDAACAGLGYTRERFAALTPADLRADHDPQAVAQANTRAMAGEKVSLETCHQRADGTLQEVALTLRRVDYRGRRLLSAVWRDITEDKRAQRRVQRLNRSYAVIGSVNEAVLRLRDRQALFAEVCRIAVEVGGFCLAWVGEHRPEDGTVGPVAWAGQADDWVRGMRITVGPGRLGPVPAAFASGRPAVVPEVTQEPGLAHRHEALAAMGQRAMAVFPVAVAGARWCCLAVYTGSGEHFDDEQVALLSRLAHDVELALQFIAAEQAQDESQRFREQIIESVAGLFFAIDTEGRVVLWNKRFEEVSGYAHAELQGRPATIFFEGDDLERIAAGVRQVFAGTEARIEASLIARNGARLPHLFVGRRLDTAAGPLLVGTGIDIADRVRTERELASYRDRLEHLVQQRTAELEAVNTRLHREDRRLRAMLELSQRASTLTEDQLFEQGLAEIRALTGSRAGCVRTVAADGRTLELRAFQGAEREPVECFARRVLDEGRSCVVDRAGIVAMGGSALALEHAIGAPAFAGDRIAMVVCATDKPTPYDEVDQRELELLAADLWQIVQRRRTELALEQAKAAADAASQAKSAFLANMSHEIRTPMNAIIGFAHLLTRDALTPRQRDHLAKVTDASQHLLQVLNDILDFSKIEAHKITLEETDFSLRDSLARVQAMQADAARVKQLPLALDLDPRCPDVVRGDRLRLEQVLLNLLSNAVKFTTAGRIGLRLALLAQADGELRVRFEVSDTGIGMSAEQLDQVFEAFAQADVSTTRRFGGTGLGLAISKRLVQLMGGRIGADSRPGQGSTFWVELPLRQTAGGQAAPPWPAAQPGAAAQARLRGARVLVVEDNPINQEVTSSLLASLGAAAQIAGSGEEALRVFDAAAHDLILMDVQMPGMDGLRATAAIRGRPGGERVPIVAMTANAFAEDRAQCLAAGMNDYLAKPVEPQALERCLLRWLVTPTPAASAAAPAPAPADAEGELRRRLERIDSLDTVGPLSRMRGAWGLYVRTLRMFVAHHGQDPERLAAVGSTDIAALRALAHSIGGAASTVGATEVMRQVQALQGVVGAAAGGPIAADAWRPLADALQRCLLEVQAALDPGAARPAAPPQPATAADSAAAAQVLAELRPLLAAHDTSALALFERQRQLLEAAYGDGAQQLGRQLRRFDFAAAEQALAALGGGAQGM